MRYTDDDIKIELERAIEHAGGLRKLAQAAGLSPTFISMVRRGQALPGPRLAAFLGYEDDGQRWVRSKGVVASVDHPQN